MKQVNINDYKCSSCDMPSVPGECELCRNRTASAYLADTSAVAAFKTFLLAGLWVSVLAAIFYILGFVATMP